MRLAVVTDSIGVRSGSRAPVELAAALAGLGDAVTLYGRNEGADPKTAQWLGDQGVSVHTLPGNRSAAAAGLAEALRTMQPNIVSFHATLPAALAVRSTNIPAVATYYGTPVGIVSDRLASSRAQAFAIPDAIARRLAAARDRRVLTAAGNAVAVSQYAATTARRLLGLELPVLPLGSALPVVLQDHSADPPILLTVSRFVPSKGFHVLLGVWQRLRQEFPNLVFTAVGSPANPRYLNWLRTSFPGAVFVTDADDAALARFYSTATLYLSADRNLFFGLPVLEAAHAGVPTVALDLASTREMVTDGQTGYVVPDISAMVDRISELLRDPEHRRSLGQTARDQAQRFAWPTVAKAYRSEFERWVR